MKHKKWLTLLIACSFLVLTACLPNKENQGQDNPYALTGKERQTILNTVKNHYYYNQLSDSQKENYLIIRQKAANFQDTISLAPASQKSLIKTLSN